MSGLQYIRLDSMSNAVTSKGLTLKDFQEAVATFPQNILLLTSETTVGELEVNTGLRMVRGEEEIRQFFNDQQSKAAGTKWIDFRNIELIREMKPIEVAELLYFGHMQTQLHSPFFYKLQNNFVFFEQENDLGKVYYRHMEEFYAVLQHSIERTLEECLNAKKLFFQKKKTITKMPSNFLDELKIILQEGIAFDFPKTIQDGKYLIHLYIVEDKIREPNASDEPIATLTYTELTQEWAITKTQEIQALFGLKED